MCQCTKYWDPIDSIQPEQVMQTLTSFQCDDSLDICGNTSTHCDSSYTEQVGVMWVQIFNKEEEQWSVMGEVPSCLQLSDAESIPSDDTIVGVVRGRSPLHCEVSGGDFNHFK